MYATDKSITDKLPDWVKIGARVRSVVTARHGTILGAFFHETLANVTLIWDGDNYTSGVRVSEVVPVTRWIPEKGETVACWLNPTKIGVVSLRAFANNHSCYDSHRQESASSWDHIARIPDNWKDEGYPLSVEWWANQEQYEED